MSKGGSQTQTVRNDPPPQLTQFYNQVLGTMGRPGFTSQPLPAGVPLVAPTDPLTTMAQGYGSQLFPWLAGAGAGGIGQLLAGGNNPALGFAQARLPQVQQAQGALFGATDPGQNPALAFNMGLAGQAQDFLSSLLAGGTGAGPTSPGPGGIPASTGSTSAAYYSGGGGGGPVIPRAPAENPYIDDLIMRLNDDVTATFERNEIPGIRDQAIATGGFGGSRQGITEGLAAGELARRLADQSAQIRVGTYESAADRASREAIAGAQARAAVSSARIGADAQRYGQDQTTARLMQQLGFNAATGVQGGLGSSFGMGLDAAQAGINPMLGLLGQGTGFGLDALRTGATLANPAGALGALDSFGQYNTGRGDLALGQFLERFNYNNTYGLNDLGVYGGILSGLGGFGTQTSTGPGRSPLGGALGGAATGAGIASTLLSSSAAAGPAGWALAGVGGLLGLFG